MSRRKLIHKIPRYSAFPSDWRELITRGQPFVVTGAARSRLSLERVAELGETTEIILKNQADGEVGQATLTELVRCVDQEGAIWYMAQHAVPACLEPLVPMRPVKGVVGLRKPNIWLGSARAFTPLHQDVLHNFIVQLDGKKQWTVFAPQDERYLYREPTEVRPNFSQIPLTSSVDLKRFPDYREARPFRVELGPRDVFVLPAYWWHEVLTLESSLMLNYWWAPTPEAVRGIDCERQIFSTEVAHRHVMKHLDLTAVKSDHALVNALIDLKLELFAAVILGQMADEFLESLAAKHHLSSRFYATTAEAMLKTRGKLSTPSIDLLREIRGEVLTAGQRLRTKVAGAPLETARLNALLRRLFVAHGLSGSKRMLENNRAWMKDVAADTYLF